MWCHIHVTSHKITSQWWQPVSDQPWHHPGQHVQMTSMATSLLGLRNGRNRCKQRTESFDPYSWVTYGSDVGKAPNDHGSAHCFRLVSYTVPIFICVNTGVVFAHMKLASSLHWSDPAEVANVPTHEYLVRCKAPSLNSGKRMSTRPIDRLQTSLNWKVPWKISSWEALNWSRHDQRNTRRRTVRVDLSICQEAVL